LAVTEEHTVVYYGPKHVTLKQRIAKEVTIMESQLELYDELMGLKDKFEQALPGLATVQDAIRNEVYKDGALSCKIKRLIALGIALRAGCTGCILAQTRRALEAGATEDEVLEATSVAVVMSGTTGGAESWRVVKLLGELKKR
jgi:AhpD family alkylhydroperoxidase